MKQKITVTRTLSILALFMGFIFISCKKEKNTNDNSSNTEAVSLSIASSTSQSLYDDAFDVVLQDGESNNVAGRLNSCATVTITPTDPAIFPKTMTIDFGTGCTGTNGIARKGKLIVVLSGRIRTAGTTISIGFENYSVNSFKLEGTYSITNNGGTGSNFTTQISNGKVTYPDGTTWYTYTGTHTLAQTAGAGTATFTDDSFSVTGNSSTASSAGKSLSINITTPLVKSAGCKNISSGTEQFIYNAIPGSLNFGDGTCDNTAVLTVGPSSQTITLPR